MEMFQLYIVAGAEYVGLVLNHVTTIYQSQRQLISV